MKHRPFALQAACAVVLVVALSVVLRWHAIEYTGPYTPDEAELLAAGRRSAMQLWLPMGTAAANTYFPLWPTSLGVLGSLGVPLTLQVAHLLSTCLYAALISMVWVATARRWGWLWPAIFIVPPAYWLLVVDVDFLALGTELPSVLVLVVCALIAFAPHRGISARRLAVVAALASLAPWFKPQSGPLAVALVISACGFAFLARDGHWDRREWSRRAALLAAGGLAPTVVLCAVMGAGGTLDLFWDEPVGFLRAYLSHHVTGVGIAGSSATMTHKLGALLPLLGANVGAFSWALVGLGGLRPGGRRSAARVAACAAVWLVPILAALATLLVLYPVYDHYLIFLYGATAMAAIAGAGLAGLPDTTMAAAPVIAGLRDPMVHVTALVAVVVPIATLFVLRGPPVVAAPTHQDDAALRALCPAHQSVLVWGWSAELYSYYDWKPASRYVIFPLLLAQTPNREHYRSRFLAELAADPPACVVDAVGPEWYGIIATRVQLEDEIPDTRGWLDRCYERTTVTFAPGDQIAVWTRRPAC